jgi:SAM-dependent methyltransferase
MSIFRLPKHVAQGMRDYHKDYDEWTKGWESDQAYMASMRKKIAPHNAIGIGLHLVSPKSRVLSIGCGPGREVGFLNERNCDITAIDHSAHMIESSKKLAPKAHFIVGDATQFVSKKPFDAITCMNNTTNYLRDFEARRRLVLNSEKNLKEGGMLIMSFNHRLSNLSTFARGAVSFGKDFYFWPSQIRAWFRGTSFTVYKNEINGVNLLVAVKHSRRAKV